MGSIWLHNLPDALEDLGNVTLYKGWESRSRRSGGYNALMGIIVHHTASSTSAYNDTKYMWENATDRPIGAIYVARNGEIIVGAAGATNCAGRGGPYATSKGTIPLDSGNSNTISIEAGNNGIGEPWPRVQQDAYVSLVAALCNYYGLDPWRDVLAHFEWTSRKIDPAGPSRYAIGRASWNMKLFRDDVKAKTGGAPPTPTPTPPTPTPTPTPPTDPSTMGDFMQPLVLKYGGTPTANWSGYVSRDGGWTRTTINGMHHARLLVALGAIDAKTGKKVMDSNWADVSHTNNAEELDEWLTPSRD